MAYQGLAWLPDSALLTKRSRAPKSDCSSEPFDDGSSNQPFQRFGATEKTLHIAPSRVAKKRGGLPRNSRDVRREQDALRRIAMQLQERMILSGRFPRINIHGRSAELSSFKRGRQSGL